MNSKKDKRIIIEVTGTEAVKFKAYRTTEDETNLYQEIGTYEVKEGTIIYEAPKRIFHHIFCTIT
jgi:hypothetical protein